MFKSREILLHENTMVSCNFASVWSLLNPFIDPGGVAGADLDISQKLNEAPATGRPRGTPEVQAGWKGAMLSRILRWSQGLSPGADILYILLP